MGKSVTLTAEDSHRLAGYRAEPPGKPRAGVVVIQEIFGVNQHIRKMTDGFAADGYLSLAPAIFDRVQRPEQLFSIALAAMRVLTDPAETGAVTIALPEDVQAEAWDVPLEFLGPLGCGLVTGAGAVLNVIKPRPDSTFVIFGAGALGFAALFAAKLLGCRNIVAVDRVKSRLQLARELGANDVIDTTTTDLDQALASLGGCDFAFDTTGVPRVIEAAIRSLKVCGELALVGASNERTMTTDIMHLISGRVVRGIVEGDAEPQSFIPFLAERFREGKFPIDRLTGFYPFEQINAAVSAGTSGATIKPVVQF